MGGQSHDTVSPAPAAESDRGPVGQERTIDWHAGAVTLRISTPACAVPEIVEVRAGAVALRLPQGLALLDIVTTESGHLPASDRLTHSAAARDLRYVSHREETGTDGRHELRVRLTSPGGLGAEIGFTVLPGIAALHVRASVLNDSATDPVALRSVTSFSARLGAAPGRSGSVADWRLDSAASDWLGETRWSSTPLSGDRIVPLGQEVTGHDPRGALRVVSTGTWSTGRNLPTGVLTSAADGAAWAWQIEHNGAWRWEVGEDTAGPWFALSGPTDDDHQWTEVLAPGSRFDAVPVTVALSTGTDAAIAELTRYRRAARRPHPDNEAMPVVFNDYMNTLSGDPTTAKLLPLIDAAAAVGAEVFCVDAGWYADGYWWDAVGEWRSSAARFPAGLGEVMDRVRLRGMTPGLWLEPEVVGVRSPIAERLPAEAFLQRHGRRLVEHERYHLDLRHPAARAHLDGVVDRLVADFGVGYFKLDYNVDPGAGTDLDAVSVGAGLLGHNRAHLAWLDGVLDRYPRLVLENCGSGAMRADFAMLSRLQLQSTSDQQDFLRYPPIAASAPASMLPEQAANWAYPQPGMTAEEVAFCLVTGLLGRFFLSGYLNTMDETRLRLVSDAVGVARAIRTDIRRSTPFWPLGRPAWDDRTIALGLDAGESRLIAVWDRGAACAAIELPMPDLAGRQGAAHQIFPTSLEPWSTDWDEGTGTLRVQNRGTSPAARVFRLQTSRRDV